MRGKEFKSEYLGLSIDLRMIYGGCMGVSCAITYGGFLKFEVSKKFHEREYG